MLEPKQSLQLYTLALGNIRLAVVLIHKSAAQKNDSTNLNQETILI